jgi:hypothetical protein
MESETVPRNTEDDANTLSIDMDTTEKSLPQSSSVLPNGHSPRAINGDRVPRPQSRGTRPPSPLKELTNTTIHPLPPSSSQFKSFRVPYPPRTKTTLDNRPATPQSPLLSPHPRLRRWSSHVNYTPLRRNSFPGTRKDALELVHALRSEAKLAREKTTTSILPPHPNKRKHSLTTPVIPLQTTGGGVTEGYFSGKHVSRSSNSDIRSRSSTTPGRMPFVPEIVRKGSNIGGRIENIRRESTRPMGPVGEDVLPSTLWDYLMLEMENQEVQGVEEHKKERLANFLRIPEMFETVCQVYLGKGG